MRLYERDYSSITEEEQQQEITITDEHTSWQGKMKVYNSGMYRKFPKAVRHYRSLFPNNLLDIEDLKNVDLLKSQNGNFLSLLNNAQTIESDIQSHIKEFKSYHIIGSILKGYHFGHHDAYLFPEFQLGNSYQVDYLLVGKASGGHQFVFVELENPYGKITTKKNDFGDVIRKGMKQISDWKIWIESNFTSLVESFEKETQKPLPKEFYKFDSSRMNYVVVAGRRPEFNDEINILRRRLLKEQNINLLHYDNLYDSAERVIGEPTY